MKKGDRQRQWISIIVALLALMLPTLASAQIQKNQEPTIRLQAKEIFRDEESGIIHAKGEVETAYNQRLLLAQGLTYDQAKEIIIAEGEVILVEPDGTVHFADRLEVTEDLKNGIANGLRTILKDNSRFAANGSVHKAGVITEMSKGVYTPCEPCRENPGSQSTWQIRARKIVHDKRTHDIHYHDAVLEFFGFPVLYTPYISQPDSTVKRRSGFLTPSFQNSNLLGLVFRTPYYYTVNDHFDFTFEPIVVSGSNLFGKTKDNVDFHVIGKGEVRAELSNGALTVGGSLTRANTRRGRKTAKEFHGNIASTGMFDINRDWRWGWKYNLTSDRTYLRRYGFSSKNDFGSRNLLDQQIFSEGFRGRNYIRIESIGFQDLRPPRRKTNTPRSIPTIDYRFVSQPSLRGSFFTLNASNSNLFRPQRYNNHRLSLGGGWHLPVTTRGGQVLSFDMTMRGDAYYITDRQENKNTRRGNLFRGRFFPQAAVSWRYPFVRPLTNSHIIIEPVAAFVASLDNNNPADIPNEDSLAIDFDDSDLFQPNRFSGYDRVETGQRFDYGILTGFFGPRNKSLQLFLGQSYRLQKQDALSVIDGSKSRRSDLVGRFILRTQPYLNVHGRWRLGADSFKPHLAEVGFSLGAPISRLSGNYLFSDNLEVSRRRSDRNEIKLQLSSRFTQNWRFFTGGTRDLDVKNGMRRLNFGLEYENDCFRIVTTAVRNYTRDRDIEPETKITVLLSFKNLGEFKVGDAGELKI